MNENNEDNKMGLNHELLANQFFNEDNQSNNSLHKNKSADEIFKNDSFDNEQKNQYHNIYFALLYLISTFIIGISCAYYYSYNNYNNRIFLPSKKIISLEQYPFYKITYKYTKGNTINIKLELEESPKNDEEINIKSEYNTDLIKNLSVSFEFYLDSIRIKMSSYETKSNLEEEKIYNLNDIDYSNKKINNYKDSNLNISISDYPFNFFIQRKEDGAILFNSDCEDQNLLYYSKNYMQICTKADEDTYFFGLGDDLINHGLNLLIGKGQRYNLYSNISDIMPFILSYNKYNMTSSGILLLNSGPIRIRMYMDQISMKFISGEINMHILAGSNVKQVIIQEQNSLGLSMIPYYSSLDWDFIQKTNRINIKNNIDLDSIYSNNRSISEFFNISFDKSCDNQNKINSIFLDSVIYSKELKDFDSFNYLFLHKTNKIIKNSFMLNNLNTIGIQESKYYYNLINEGKLIESQSRPLLFSSRAFLDSSTFSYKLIKDIPFTFEGIRLAMNRLKSQSLFGNSYCYIEFESNSFNQNRNNSELVLRWSQLLSILPFANINNLDIPLYIKNFRYIFSLYIYIYFIIISTEGGTYFRPLFYDLKSNTINEDLISKRYQIMLGSNILVEPIFYSNLTNMTTLFPEDKFYDFYTGKHINKLGDGYYQVFFEKYKLPLFLRGGKITPVQLLDELYDVYIKDSDQKNNIDNNFNSNLFDINLSIETLKDKPLQLLIALDNNLQAQGRILIDDFVSNDSKKKKNFYKMLITVSQRTSDISIFFRVYSFKYNLPKSLYKNCINRLIIYGFTKMTVRKITIMNKNGRTEIDKSKLIISQVNDILTIPNINIPLNMDTKILII